MDELQISGRRFISSRRIAKENGYHTDYIGQLIRGGKIKGQKVGRTWYVDAETFDAYLGQEPSQESASKKSSGLLSESQPDSAGQTFSQQIPAEAELVVASSPVVVLTPEPSAPAEVTIEPVVEAAESKVEIKKITEDKEEEAVNIPVRKIAPQAPARPAIVVTRGVTTPTGLRYVSDDEPLLPEISASENITRVMPALEPEVRQAAQEEGAPVVFSAGRLLGGIAIAGVLVFIFSAVVSSAMVQKINIEQGNPASVGYALQW